jgi:hypothetical protein
VSDHAKRQSLQLQLRALRPLSILDHARIDGSAGGSLLGAKVAIRAAVYKSCSPHFAAMCARPPTGAPEFLR